jgi:uncharacterized protein with von Willebrand factor type A (vWA) domain
MRTKETNILADLCLSYQFLRDMAVRKLVLYRNLADRANRNFAPFVLSGRFSPKPLTLPWASTEPRSSFSFHTEGKRTRVRIPKKECH